MTDLFGGIPVRSFDAAKPWYVALFGAEPSFMATPTEGVWEVVQHGYLYVVQTPSIAGHARHTVFVDDLDAVVAAISARGVEPAMRETYGNGVRKTTYRDADGNEIGYGGAPLD